VNLYSLFVYIEHNGNESPKVQSGVCTCIRSGKHLHSKDRVVIFLRKLIASKHTANLYVTEHLSFHCYRCDKLISVVYLTTLSVIPNYSQQDATFLDSIIFAVALHVSGGSSAHHQEHITVHTASGIVNQYCC